MSHASADLVFPSVIARCLPKRTSYWIKFVGLYAGYLKNKQFPCDSHGSIKKNRSQHFSADCDMQIANRFYATQKLKANSIANSPINKMLAIVQARSKTGFLPQRASMTKTAGAART
jgi:hypothetical protein